MSFLLDTNIVSEVVRKRPADRVHGWLQSVPTDQQFVSAMTVGELLFGIERLSDGQRKTELRIWFETDFLVAKGPRILPFDAVVAGTWAQLRVAAKRTLPGLDSLIAATALHHGLALATRNVRDFEGLGLRLVDPFAFGAGG